ncbi:MAG: type II toxin-antitoxin system VapC family toxin [Acidithiobacillales bacterium]
MRRSVLDSYAVLAFLFKEKGHEKVVTALEKAAESDRPLLIVAPNWAEVRYQVERKAGAEAWRRTREKLLGLPVEVVPADQELSEQVGEIKARRKMSLADCFAAALAKTRKADLYTGDPEFREVQKEVRIIWL